MSDMDLTPEQRWDFDCRGYLCLPDFLDLETVEELIAIATNYEKPHYSQNESDRTRINVQVLTTPVWIRSGEAENLLPEVLASLPEEHQKRLIAKPW